MGILSELLLESTAEGAFGLLSPAGNAKVLRNCATKEVKCLWRDFLRSYPVRFSYPGVIDDKYIVAFHCEEAGLIIEIVQKLQVSPLEHNKQKKRLEAFATKGLTVLQITTEDINRNFESVCEEINQTVKMRISST